MYLHPEMPSYEDQIRARDNFVAAHPGLRFVGAHLGSLEYDVDRIAAFLDRYPNANVDMAARMSQVQYQSVRNYDKVRNFFIRYQDRLLYGTDLTLNPGEAGNDAQKAEFKRSAHEFWTQDWRYLATPGSQRVEMIKADVPGLALPREVIRHELPEDQRVCPHDGARLSEIGVESSEQLDIIPQQVRVVRMRSINRALASPEAIGQVSFRRC
jgi:hypothetical protein